MSADKSLSRAAWRKSSRSANNGGNCVEVAAPAASVLVRDSKLSTNPVCPVLGVTRNEWQGFLADVQADRLTS